MIYKLFINNIKHKSSIFHIVICEKCRFFSSYQIKYLEEKNLLYLREDVQKKGQTTKVRVKLSGR